MNRQFRQHFPFFQQNPDWVYLDSAATTLKPQVLIDSSVNFYHSAGSVHRSQYDLNQTQAFEHARHLVAERFFLPDPSTVIWTNGTTHSLNLVAQGLADQISVDDEIIITVGEHHANFIPWQQLALQKGAKLIVLPLNENYQIDENTLIQALSVRTKIVSFNLVSNVTGLRQPAETLIPIIRQYSSAKIVLDLAQAVCTERINTQQLDADFYAFSAHKLYGPTGVGVLMGKKESLNELRPLFFGGKMLQDVSEQYLTLAPLPYRLEAGTPNIAGIIGFGEVLKWLNQWDFTLLNQKLYRLSEQLYKQLISIKNLQMLGKEPQRTTFSFQIKGQHHADIAAILTEQNVAIRAGEHCAKPYLRYLNKAGTLRISLAHYNTEEDIKCLITALHFALEVLNDV